jgi:hypothetical protein
MQGIKNGVRRLAWLLLPLREKVGMRVKTRLELKPAGKNFLLGMQGMEGIFWRWAFFDEGIGLRLVEWMRGNGIYHEGREDHEGKTKRALRNQVVRLWVAVWKRRVFAFR